MIASLYILASVLCVASGNTVRSFVAYDCSNIEYKRQIYLGDVQPCEPPATPENSTKVYGAVVQAVTRDLLHIISCKVKVLSSICRCGVHSHCSSPMNGITEDYIEMSRDDCIKAHNDGQWYYKNGEQVFYDLKVNSTFRQARVTKGVKNSAGDCEGQRFIFRGMEYSKSTLEQDFHISLYEHWAKLSVRTNEVILPGGVVCDFKSLGCKDEVTMFYWLQKDGGENCVQNKFRYLVYGNIDIVNMTTINNDDKNKYGYAVVEIKHYVFALKLTEKTKICDQFEGFWTEHNNLFFVPLPTSENPFNKALPSDIDMSLYLNSKLLFFELSNVKKMAKFASDMILRRCELERQTLLHKLTLVKDNPENTAKLFGDQSLSGTISGEVLYLSRCNAVYVKFRRTLECWNAAPVVIISSNKTAFMNALTHKLVDFAEQIPCSLAAPPVYRINRTFIEISPLIREVGRKSLPDVLAPSVQKIEFSVDDRIFDSGIYTSEDLELYSTQLKFGDTRSARTSALARTVAGMDLPRNSLALDNLIPTEVKEVFAKFRNFSLNFGLILVELLGYYSIWWILRHIIGIVLNAMDLHHVAGCGFHIVLSIFEPLTRLFVNRRVVRMAKQPRQPEEDKLNGRFREPFGNVYLNGQNYGDRYIELGLPRERELDRPQRCIIQ